VSLWRHIFGSLHDYSFWDLARYYWPVLLIYYGFLARIGYDFRRTIGSVARGDSRKSWLIAALIIAGIVTPGTISDFFFLALPGPAILGLLLAAFTGVISGVMFSLPSACRFVLALAGDYIVPILLVAALLYCCFALVHHFNRAPRTV
jgi:hypothetical protein